MQLTLDEQLKMMKHLVPEWAIQTDNRVAHGKPWVPHEYVTHMLDMVFGPDCWNFEVSTIKPTRTRNSVATAASMRRLKTVRWISSTLAAGTAPSAS